MATLTADERAWLRPQVENLARHGYTDTQIAARIRMPDGRELTQANITQVRTKYGIAPGVPSPPRRAGRGARARTVRLTARGEAQVDRIRVRHNRFDGRWHVHRGRRWVASALSWRDAMDAALELVADLRRAEYERVKGERFGVAS